MGDVQEAVDLVPARRVDRGRPDAAAPGRSLDLVEATAPELIAALEPVRRAVGSSREAATAEAVYAALPSINFSRSVLARAPDRFVTMPVSGLEWSDLGDPRRVVATLRGTGQPISWFTEATPSWRMEGNA